MAKVYHLGTELHDGTFDGSGTVTFTSKAKAIQCAKRLAKNDSDMGVSRWTVECGEMTIAAFKTKFDRLSHIR